MGGGEYELGFVVMTREAGGGQRIRVPALVRPPASRWTGRDLPPDAGRRAAAATEW
jgi:hypothetical protein